MEAINEHFYAVKISGLNFWTHLAWELRDPNFDYICHQNQTPFTYIDLSSSKIPPKNTKEPLFEQMNCNTCNSDTIQEDQNYTAPPQKLPIQNAKECLKTTS